MAEDLVRWARDFNELSTIRQTDRYGNVTGFGPFAYLQGDQETLSYRYERGLDDIQTEEDLIKAAGERSGYGLTDIPPHDVGHEFYTRKRSIKVSHPAVTVNDPDTRISYQGPLIPNIGTPHLVFKESYRDIPRLTTNAVNTYGTRAISACAPTQPSANVAAFLGELLEQLPQIIGLSIMSDRAHYFSQLGGEYLNVEFGWKPFVSDIRKMLEAVRHSARIISQYERDAGKVVRRRFSFPTRTENSESTLMGTGQPPYLFFSEHEAYECFEPGYSAVIHKLQHLEERYWFSGAFTYNVASSDSAWGHLVKYEQLSNRLLGNRITPAVLWELTPWSWLADWVADIGSIITNATLLSQDGLVMRYGYLMRQTTAIDTYTPVHAPFKIGMFGHATAQLSVVQKERARATPFGFGLDTESFTARQWAILAALGLSRGNRVSW
jgi:hypothetical protein